MVKIKVVKNKVRQYTCFHSSRLVYYFFSHLFYQRVHTIFSNFNFNFNKFLNLWSNSPLSSLSITHPSTQLWFRLLPLSRTKIYFTHTFYHYIPTQVAPPFRVVELDILFGSGIDTYGCLLDAAENVGVVERKGSWYNRGETRFAQGTVSACQFVDVSVCLFVCLSDWLAVWLSVCLSVCLTGWLSMCLSV